MSTEKLNLKRFDPSKIDPSSVVCFIGKRNTGKTTLVKDILYRLRHHFPTGIVISPTEESNRSYGEIIPPTFIYDKYDESIVNRLVHQQKKAIRKGATIGNNAFLLLDDCMYQKGWARTEVIRHVIMNGRHFQILFLLTLQYMMDIGPDFRCNVDYVFALRDTIQDNQTKLYKYFFGIFPTFLGFQQVFQACTSDYECMVIDNTKKSLAISDCIFFYKADPNLDYRIGPDTMWAFNDRHFNRHYQSDEEDDVDEKESKSRRRQTFDLVKGKMQSN